MDVGGTSRRGAWRILLGVEDDAALRRALLAEARDRRAAGADVVVGCSAPAEDAARQVDGMPVVMVRPTPYGYDGVDLQAIRQLRPDVVVLDDLARLTPSEAERIPDVDALRLLGTDVVCALHAAQIRSLAGRLGKPTAGPLVTIPDRALLEVDEVEVIAGDSPAAVVAVAREWAERPRPRTAGVTDDAPGDQRWPGRIVVALVDDDQADAVLERAADLARLTGVRLVGADIAPTGQTADHARLRWRHRMLEAVDADIVDVVDDSPGWALARVAEAEGAQIVMQRGGIDGPLLLDHQTAGARGLDLYIVAPPNAASADSQARPSSTATRRSLELPRRRRAAGAALAVVGVPLLTVVLIALRGTLDLSTVLLLYLALTVGVTAVGGFWPGLVSALGGFALAVFYFTQPLNRWTIDDPNVIVAIGVFVAVAVLVSVLVGVAARRTADAERASSEAVALGRIAAAILTTRDPLPRLLHDLRVVLGLDAAAILRPTGDAWEVEYAAGDPVPRRPADATDALSVGAGRYLVLSGDRVPAADSRVLAAFAAQLALAVGQRAEVRRP